MTTNVAYDWGLDRWGRWQEDPYGWLLVRDTYTPDQTHYTVEDVAGHECDAAGYARATMSGPERSIVDDDHHIRYRCDPPSFGSPAAGQTISGVVLFFAGDTDATSYVMAFYDLGAVATDGTEFTPDIPGYLASIAAAP